MAIRAAKMVALDSATLGKVSRDYWSKDVSERDKARSFLARLRRLGIFVAFSGHHVNELLRHGDEEEARDRLRFLRSIPLVAWLRSYDRNWFPGGILDLFLHELHAVAHGSARNWRAIVDEVRVDLWQTGTGSEMLPEDDWCWATIRQEFARLHEKEKYIASIDRTDAGQCRDMKISEALRLSLRPREERDAYVRWFVQEVQEQLHQHGDERLDHSHEAAISFANSIMQDVGVIDEMEGNLVQRIAEWGGVPYEFVSPKMTISEFGELAVYATRLKTLSRSLHPPRELTVRDVPPNSLPSYVLETRLASIQRKADRVSGSDLGDDCITPLVLYTDAIEVDKRTCEFLKQMLRGEPELVALVGRFFRTIDYSQIPELLDE